MQGCYESSLETLRIPMGLELLQHQRFTSGEIECVCGKWCALGGEAVVNCE